MIALILRLLASVVISLRAVRRNTLRAALTIVGITIGVAALVTVTALASGARMSISDQIMKMGSNSLAVFPRSGRSSGVRTTQSSSRLTESDCDFLTSESTSIKLAAPLLKTNTQVVYENQNANARIVGTRLGYFEVRNWKLQKGALWTPLAEAVSDRVVVIGQQTAHELFGSVDPIGRTIRIGRDPYEVLGLLEEKGAAPFEKSEDETVLMPITTLRSHIVFTRPGDTSVILLSATSAETTARAKQQAESILRQRHHIKEGDEDDFTISSQAEFQAMQDAILSAITALLIGVAAISLVVGGIGIMNIMLVSVTERTREIGVRMAIGAREADIMTQFLCEALLLATLGGLIGTVFGYIAIVALGKVLGWPMKLDLTSLGAALGVSTLVGLVFGFFPARRAAQMDPVQALGRE